MNFSFKIKYIYLCVCVIVIVNCFGSGLDSTVLAQNVANYLNLSGKERSKTFSSRISKNLKVKSKLVNISLSSKFHPMWIKFENVWVVDELNLITYKLKQNFHKDLEHLKDIDSDVNSTNVSLLIGADMTDLHLPNQIRKGNKNEPNEIRFVLC